MAIWAPWARVLVCGDYLSPVEIPMLSATGSRDAYLATLERLRPLVEQAEWVVPGHGAPIEGARAPAILDEDVRYLTDWELPLTRRTAVQRAIDAENRERVGERPEAGEARATPRRATSASITTQDSASAWISKYESLKALQWGATWLAITPSALHVPDHGGPQRRARVVAQREHERERRRGSRGRCRRRAPRSRDRRSPGAGGRGVCRTLAATKAAAARLRASSRRHRRRR